MAWNPLARFRGTREATESTESGNAADDTPSSDPEASAQLTTSTAINESAEPSGHSRKKCFCEICIVVVAALALIVGLAIYYGQKKSVSNDMWDDIWSEDPEGSGYTSVDVDYTDSSKNSAPSVAPTWAPTSAEEALRAQEIEKALDVYTPSLILKDETTPQHRAFRWMTWDDPRRLHPDHNLTFGQRYALVTMYYSMVEDYLGDARFENWLTEENECFWGGITCGAELSQENELNDMVLSGPDNPVPGKDEQRGDGFHAGDAYYDTDMPRPVIRIDLTKAGLSGTIPGEIGSLHSLEFLNLSHNQLLGSIPVTVSLLSSLIFLRLDQNMLSGMIPLKIGDLQSLEELYLHANRLSGSIPASLGALHGLRVATFNNNTLTGRIPESIGQLNALEDLELGYNNLTGFVPASVCDLGMHEFGQDFNQSLPRMVCSCCYEERKETTTAPDKSSNLLPLATTVNPVDENEHQTVAPSVTTLDPLAKNEPQTEAPPHNEHQSEAPISEKNSSASWGQVGPDIFGVEDGGEFGSSVSLSWDGRRFVASSVENPVNDGRGKANETGGKQIYVRVYEHLISSGKSSGFYTQVGTAIVGDDVLDTTTVGHFACTSGNGERVAVSTFTKPAGSTTNTTCGKVRVYDYRGGDWVQLGGDITWSDAYCISFGTSIALSQEGDRIAIGSPYHNSSGRVDVFQYLSNEAWEIVGSGVEGTDPSGLFGWSVSLSGNGSVVAVGAPSSDVGEELSSGIVSVYEVGDVWTLRGSRIVDQSPKKHYFGHAVSLERNGDMVAIGAPGTSDLRNNSTGMVCVFQYNGSEWAKLGNEIDEGHVGDKSGYSVALSADGRVVAVGAPGDGDSEANGGGRASVYRFQNDQWTLIGSSNGTTARDRFGQSVSVSEDGALVISGAPMSETFGRGYVRVHGYDDALSRLPMPSA